MENKEPNGIKVGEICKEFFSIFSFKNVCHVVKIRRSTKDGAAGI
jgi:hypothetical protein